MATAQTAADQVKAGMLGDRDAGGFVCTVASGTWKLVTRAS